MPAPKDPQRYEEWKKELSQKNRGQRRSQEVRDKISAANRKRVYGPRSEETKAKMSASTKGRKLTDEHKAKLSAAGKGKKISDEQKKKISVARTGYKMSDDQKQKLSEAGKRRTLSESHKAALIAANTGRKMSDEHKAIVSQVHKGKTIPKEMRERISASVRQHNESLSEEEKAELYEKTINAIKAKDTSIELYVAKLLDESGVEYVTQKRIGHYFVDFFLPETNTVVETNGCWWHACDPCGYNKTEYAADKRRRDEKRISFIKKKGYTVIILWEHDLSPAMKAEGFVKE
jgi:G:T-mismatch repair DNA endonuclease (very short patch repair protein)